jgi:glycosyltransferase involved in cell wall biosynthesis
MKIIFIIDTLGSGGKERRLTELLKKVKLSPDIEFELIVMSTNIHYKEVLNLGINIHFIIRKTKKDLSVFFKIYKLCKSYNPDIVHCWDSMTAVYVVPACKLLKIKMVNGMVIDSPVKRNILNKEWLRAKLTFPFSDIIVGNSCAGLKAYGAPSDKSCCIYNGLDLSRFTNLKDPTFVCKDIFGEISSDFFIIGMVAAFEDRKDYRTLIKAAISIIPRRNYVRFILIGEGANLPFIKESVPQSLMNKITFLGKRSDVESIVNIFDIGVLLTNAKVHGEGISNSIIEYMALGKPVIATRGGGTDELIIDNHNGFLIEPAHADQLIEKIESMIENKLLITKLGNFGKKMVEERFDIEIMTKNYVSLYKKLLCL